MNSDSQKHIDTQHFNTDLRGRSMRGGAATMISQASLFLLTLGGTAILARLLTPEDFGLLAMIASYVTFINMFRDLGLSMATVQQEILSHNQVSTLFWTNLGIGVLMCLLTLPAAPVLAWFYGEPELTLVSIALGTAFIFGGLSVQHQALLRRQMQFSSLAKLQVAAPCVGILLGIGSAYAGAGYWSLVIMQIGQAAAMAGGLWLLCDWRPGRPVRKSGVRKLLGFGGYITAGNIVNFFGRNLDNILIGWQWGKGPLGFYAKAYQLLMLPIQQINAPLNSIAIPVLSRLQDDPERFRGFCRRGIQLVTCAGLPIVAFLWIDAEPVIALVLGDQWSDSVPIFRALGPAAAIGTNNVATGWVFIALGHVRRRFYWMIIGSVAVCTSFFIGLPYGPIGVATAFSFVSVVMRIPALMYCYHGTPMRLADVGWAVWRPLVCSCAAMGVVAGLADISSTIALLAIRVLVDGIAFSLAFTGCWLLLPGGKESLLSLWSLSRFLREEPTCNSDEKKVESNDFKQTHDS